MAHFTAHNFLLLGFQLRDFKGYEKVNLEAQRAYFKSLYGPSLAIMSMIWQELLHADLEHVTVDKYTKPIHLLLYFRWLRSYKTEAELRTMFNIGEETLRKWIRIMAKNVSALRAITVC